MDFGVRARANSLRVALLTATSVHWADRMTAMSNSNALR